MGTVYKRQLESRQHTKAMVAKIRARMAARPTTNKGSTKDLGNLADLAGKDTSEEEANHTKDGKPELPEEALSPRRSAERGSEDVWSPVLGSPVSSHFRTTLSKPTFTEFAVKVQPTKIEYVCPRSERFLLRSESVGRSTRIRGAIIYPEPPEVRVKIRKLKKGLASDQVYKPNYEEIMKRTSVGILAFDKMAGRGAPRAVKPNMLKNILPLAPVRSVFDNSVNTLCGYDKLAPRERDQASPYPAYLQKGYGGRIVVEAQNQKSHELNGHSLLTPINHDFKPLKVMQKQKKLANLLADSVDDDEPGAPKSQTAREIDRMMATLRTWRPLEHR